MGIPIPITATPQRISQTVSKPYLIYNTGAATVYLGQDSSVSPMAYSFPLAPGNAFQWTELSSDVYGVTDTGKSSQLVIAYEASALALGNLQISGDVGINGPVDVRVDTGQLYSQPGIGVAAGNSVLLDTQAALVDISPYQSLEFSISTINAFGSPATAVSIITIDQYAGGVQVASKPYYFLGSGSIDITFDLLGDRVVFGMFNGITLTNYEFNLVGYRVAREEAAALYPMPGQAAYFSPSLSAGVRTHYRGYEGFDASTVAAGVSTAYLPHITGENYSYMELPAGGAWALQYFTNPVNNSGRIQNYNPVGTGAYNTNPPTPIYLRPYPIVLSSAGTTLSGNRVIYSLTARTP